MAEGEQQIEQQFAIPSMWHYAADGKQQGPVELSRLQELWTAGTLTKETHLWKESMESWMPVPLIAPCPVSLPIPLIAPGTQCICWFPRIAPHPVSLPSCPVSVHRCTQYNRAPLCPGSHPVLCNPLFVCCAYHQAVVPRSDVIPHAAAYVAASCYAVSSPTTVSRSAATHSAVPCRATASYPAVPSHTVASYCCLILAVSLLQSHLHVGNDVALAIRSHSCRACSTSWKRLLEVPPPLYLLHLRICVLPPLPTVLPLLPHVLLLLRLRLSVLFLLPVLPPVLLLLPTVLRLLPTVLFLLPVLPPVLPTVLRLLPVLPTVLLLLPLLPTVLFLLPCAFRTSRIIPLVLLFPLILTLSVARASQPLACSHLSKCPTVEMRAKHISLTKPFKCDLTPASTSKH